MGAWGDGLYEDDLTLDVKETFLNVWSDVNDCEIATQKILKIYEEELKDVEDAPLIWFALAETEYKKGILLDYVRDKAIAYIDEGIDLERWKESIYFENRKRILTKLKMMLLSPQPEPQKPKKKRKPPKPFECPWKIGDVLAYPLLSDVSKYCGIYGRYLILIKVVDYDSMYGPGNPGFVSKLTEGTELPKTMEEVDKLETLPIFHVSPPFSGCDEIKKIYIFHIPTETKRSIPKELIYLGNTQNTVIPSTFRFGFGETVWKNLESWFGVRYNKFALGNFEFSIRQFLDSRDAGK